MYRRVSMDQCVANMRADTCLEVAMLAAVTGNVWTRTIWPCRLKPVERPVFEIGEE